ncbi:MAG: ShlB/FhaC/HecB family hemolysin secretion/activation protein [Reichenbachiella sp.]|uniref:ShlB/FhaC/HecB family hemolysin secretion/activation protein n=1 Tax=Reichenbachiella sp. TaxID=2184521 RepID=UPI003298B60D
MYRQFRKHIISFCCALGLIGNLLAQTSDSVSQIIYFEGIDNKYIPKQSAFDSSELEIVKKSLIAEMRQDGYWLASYDSTQLVSDTLKVFVYQGRSFEDVEITIIDDNNSLNKLSRFPKIKTGKITSPSQIELEIDQLLEYLERNGYPFATLSVVSSAFLDDKLSLQLNLDIGTKITYDSLTVNPKGLIKPAFLSKYLGLDFGKNYDERDIAQVEDRIQYLPFLSLEKVSTSFKIKKASVELDLKHRKVNYFDGILGLVPGQDGEGVEVTGELDLSINNLFQSGKKVEINWKKLEPGSQQLHASYLHPILLGSPLDFYFELDQIRQDTIYSNRSLQVAFDYRTSKNLSMRVSYESLLGNELDDFSGTSGDFNIDYYGLSFDWHHLDQLFNPKNGIRTKFIVNVGKKSVTNVDTPIPESTQYRLRATIDWYKKFSTRSVLYVSSQNGLIFNDYLYLNDLFRLGGLKTIRGFNELEFFASKYALINLEWRYYIEASSYLVAFYDQSIMSYEILGGSHSDRPSGLGAGMQFNTDRGNFKILYGLGKRDGESFSFATSKIHFGYTAIF